MSKGVSSVQCERHIEWGSGFKGVSKIYLVLFYCGEYENSYSLPGSVDVPIATFSKNANCKCFERNIFEAGTLVFVVGTWCGLDGTSIFFSNRAVLVALSFLSYCFYYGVRKCKPVALCCLYQDVFLSV